MTVRPETFKAFAEMAEAQSGLVLGEAKAYLIEHRLTPIATEEGVTLDELARRIRTTPALAQRCAEALLTYESYWFRDTKPFDSLREMLAAHEGPWPVRILSLACSTGQEPYSVALLATGLWPDAASRVKITATDISEAALRRARGGVYTQQEVSRGLPAPLLAKHFHRVGAQWELDAGVRAMVEFRRGDLRGTLPAVPGGWDFILVRNVLIYMEPEVRDAVVRSAAKQLKPGGRLLLGGGEPAPPVELYRSEVRDGVRWFQRQG